MILQLLLLPVTAQPSLWRKQEGTVWLHPPKPVMPSIAETASLEDPTSPSALLPPAVYLRFLPALTPFQWLSSFIILWLKSV